MHCPELCFKQPLAKGLIPFNRTVPVRVKRDLPLAFFLTTPYDDTCDFKRHLSAKTHRPPAEPIQNRKSKLRKWYQNPPTLGVLDPL